METGTAGDPAGAAVAGLPPRRQEVFRLVRQCGLSYEEVAGVMEISRHAVADEMGMALASLRDTLAAERADSPAATSAAGPESSSALKVTDELIVRTLSGIANPDEAERVERWRLKSSANETYFQRTSCAWTATAPPRPDGSATHARVSRVLEEVARRTSDPDPGPIP